ncbi:TetR family transcriptional regulator [Nonomuraea phyllanthi]|uniref:TetR family transcriptional regulator n=1 Tax=Nonomuraea phyllanthi TaxID=2219224 RepID=A0A5C4WUA3_9ACTN|nr:TetR-like C-terminal domain-containing protein [Nonomuraea phyllanthi]KAB8196796.1 TetR family transcriptional regulator [Nonomuraea phyllanthi]QFY13467.1 TetR family transcriptional regulator [Nonomuraea phyllanthi]
MARAGVTSERVTRAAAELADEIGFDRVTGSAVARRLGVKEPSLYAHIANARELKVRVALLALEEMADQAAAALAGRAGKDALVALANVYRDYARRHPGRYAASRFELDPETAARSAGPRHTEMTRALLRGYDLPEPDQTDAVRLLGGAFHGYVSLELSGSFRHTERSTDASWAWALDTLDHALRTHPARRAGG